MTLAVHMLRHQHAICRHMTRLCPPLQAAESESGRASIPFTSQPWQAAIHHMITTLVTILPLPSYMTSYTFFFFGCILHPSFVTCNCNNQIYTSYWLAQSNVQCSQGITCLLLPCFLFSRSVYLPLILSGCRLFSLNVSFPLIVLVILLMFYLGYFCVIKFLIPTVVGSLRCYFPFLSSLLFHRPLQYSIALSLASSLSPAEFHIPSFSYCQCICLLYFDMTGDWFQYLRKATKLP